MQIQIRQCKRHGTTEYVLQKTGYFRCRKCCSEAPGVFHSKLRNEIVKLCGNRCAICGYNKCKRALDFHHIDPSTKEFCISIKGIARKRVLKELEKCVLLCSNCHREVEEGISFIPIDIVRFDFSSILNLGETAKIPKVPKLRPTKIQYPSNLAELVWTKPIEAIANELGVSGNALARYCKRRNIQTPTRGFWTKLNSRLLYLEMIIGISVS